MPLAHGILTPQALGLIHNLAQEAHDREGARLALPREAVQALIEDIVALRAHLLHLLPTNWDEVPEARAAIAHLRSTCTREVADALLLASGLVAADPEAEPAPVPTTALTIIHPGDSEGGAP